MLSLSNDEWMRIQGELNSHPRHFALSGDSVELGSSWMDLCAAAALMTGTGYWGNSPEHRRAGVVDHGYQPGTLRLVIKKMVPGGGVFLIYVIAGDRAGLYTMKWWFDRGMLFVVDKAQFGKHQETLVAEYLDAKRKAAAAGVLKEGERVGI